MYNNVLKNIVDYIYGRSIDLMRFNPGWELTHSTSHHLCFSVEPKDLVFLENNELFFSFFEIYLKKQIKANSNKHMLIVKSSKEDIQTLIFDIK